MTAHPIVTTVRVQAPATIPLHLGVGEPHGIGSRDVVTVLHAVDLYDELVITRAARLRVTTTGARGAPEDVQNVAGAAARTFADHLGVAAAVSIEITKRIPVGVGLAGASADAAGALVGCAALWGADLSRDELAAIGAEIRPGVPFSLSGGTALGAGGDERLSPVLARTPLHWVLAMAGIRLAAPTAMAQIDRLRASGSPRRAGDVRDILAALGSGDPTRVAEHLANDFEPAAISLMPALRQTRRAGLDAGALAAVVVGAGPTIALLAASREAAENVAAELAGSGTCRTVQLASGPVPGARVVGSE